MLDIATLVLALCEFLYRLLSLAIVNKYYLDYMQDYILEIDT